MSEQDTVLCFVFLYRTCYPYRSDERQQWRDNNNFISCVASVIWLEIPASGGHTQPPLHLAMDASALTDRLRSGVLRHPMQLCRLCPRFGSDRQGCAPSWPQRRD